MTPDELTFGPLTNQPRSWIIDQGIGAWIRWPGSVGCRKISPERTRGYFLKCFWVGLVRIELTTSSLSVTRSNRLSYSPKGYLIYTK